MERLKDNRDRGTTIRDVRFLISAKAVENGAVFWSHFLTGAAGENGGNGNRGDLIR
jgi:hypothetical protein